MRKFKHLIFDERNLFKDLLLSDTCKKKNGSINLLEIARQMGLAVNTVKREINRFKNIEDYIIHMKHKKINKQKRKNLLKNRLHLQKNNKNF